MFFLLFVFSAFAEEDVLSPKAEVPKELASESKSGAEVGRVDVVLMLSNGLRMEGSISSTEALSWSVGDDISIILKGADTENKIPGDKIISMKSASQMVDESQANSPSSDEAVRALQPQSPLGYVYPNAAPTRYLYAPSSIGLQKNQGYISQKLVFTSVAYAPTDRWTILFGTFTFFPPALSVLGGKYSRPINENLSVSAGGEVFIIGFDADNRLPVAIAYTGLTWGDTDRNLTVSTGFARDNELVSSSGSIWPVMVAGQTRVHERFSLVSENWIFTDLGLGQSSERSEIRPYVTGGIASFSLRILGRRDTVQRITASKKTADGYPRATWDIGLVGLVTTEQDYFYDYETDERINGSSRELIILGPLPWVDYSWHFGPVRR